MKFGEHLAPRLRRVEGTFLFRMLAAHFGGKYLGSLAFTSPLYPKLIWLKTNAAPSGRALTRLSPNLANNLDSTGARDHPHHDRQTPDAVAAH
jgi:hypothetical protein